MNILVRLDDEREIAGPATVLAVGTTAAEYERVVNVSRDRTLRLWSLKEVRSVQVGERVTLDAEWTKAPDRHTSDADCRAHLDAEQIECTVCGASWSDGCSSCGGHAYHADGCPEIG